MKKLLALLVCASLAWGDYVFDPVVLDAIKHAECDRFGGKCHPYTIRLNRKDDRKKAAALGLEPNGCLLRFETKTEAEDAARLLAENAVTNMDLGPYQINYKWHPAPLGVYFEERLARAFATIILKRLTDAYGYSWQTLARYHSATAKLNKDYYLKLHNYIYAKETRQ